VAKNYRVGIIGRTGQGNYGHGLDTVWADVPRTEVVAVADEHEGGRAAVAKKTGAKAAYADYRRMLAKERPDIVAIGPRWIDQHHAMATACAEHGCHVYMEKPFVRTLEEADDVVRAFEMRHLKLAIAHQTRYCPVLDTAIKLVADGAIGDLLEIRGRGKEDARGGGEDLWVLGSHVMDMMRAFCGDAAICYATVTVEGRPITRSDAYDGNEGIGPLAGDTVNATYAFSGRVTGYFASHRRKEGRPTRFGVQIFGSKGVLEFYMGYLTTAYVLKDSSWSPGRSGAKWQPISSAGVGRPEPRDDAGLPGGNVAAVLDLLDAIENDRQPKCGMYDARATVEMIAAVFESQRVGGPVALPLENRRSPLTML
jgi:predicted dehydrogenase